MLVNEITKLSAADTFLIRRKIAVPKYTKEKVIHELQKKPPKPHTFEVTNHINKEQAKRRIIKPVTE
jgi:hypothetical protein